MTETYYGLCHLYLDAKTDYWTFIQLLENDLTELARSLGLWRDDDDNILIIREAEVEN